MRCDNTQDYYARNADAYFSATLNIDMTTLYDRFLPYIPTGGLILDAGCGSGRDSKAFQALGYQIRAFDRSAELACLAAEVLSTTVDVKTFHEVEEENTYDGIWACASLLHLREQEIPSALKHLSSALRANGVLYLSFKVGESEHENQGRHFTDATAERLHSWLKTIPELSIVECWETQDSRSDSSERWLNGILKRCANSTKRLITGGEHDHFFPQIGAAIERANEISLAVSFIKTTGLRMLLPSLQFSLAPERDRGQPPARVRIITSDYLDISDPEAFRLLMLLQEQGAQVRVYDARGSSFHMKAYIFTRLGENKEMLGTAFIGSSNISRQALTTGMEWNYRIEYPGDDGYLEASAHFEVLYRHDRTIELTDKWIGDYEARRVPPSRAVAPGSDEREAPPTPTQVQEEALARLNVTREEGYRRGLVVLATGLGKTWLAAFDAEQTHARRVLFVAHREEILNQAAETFIRIRPRDRIGYYMGRIRDTQVDVLCASIQTLGRLGHLERFSPYHFDYIVVDEFHHAAAPSYRHLLNHFSPHFLLGLTATPDRSDQSDILSLCDDNLVFNYDLFSGVTSGLLAPFHYYGIWDASVDYKTIPWRNGRFDPEQLTAKLATMARASHTLAQWRDKAQKRTLAFCVSIRHAEYMANYFNGAGIASAAVHTGSRLSRVDALVQLAENQLKVIFSVDLFNEGVDLPAIDTVMMLRPTDSKLLFLQQVGRGLRKAEGKQRLVVIDFVGNHHSFLNKLQALAQIGSSYHELARLALDIETQRFKLPAGCYMNFDLALINFLKSLDSDSTSKEYEALRSGLGRRPTLTEFYRAGASVSRMRQQYGSWFTLVKKMEELADLEERVLGKHADFIWDVEVTAITKSFKMIVIEALAELDGWRTPPSLSALAERSWEVLQRRRALLTEVPMQFHVENRNLEEWRRYWEKNPIAAWLGANKSGETRPFFQVEDGKFRPSFAISQADSFTFGNLIQEIVDYRLAAYEVRRDLVTSGGGGLQPNRVYPDRYELPYFPDLRIACGHFKTGFSEVVEHRRLGVSYGRLDPARHFVARASGNSMEGGKNPIHDGDYLLLELITPTAAGSITGQIIAIERQDESGDNQYLLRFIVKAKDGTHILRAANPQYEDIVATLDMRTFARLKSIVDPLEMVVGRDFIREEIPGLFGESFNPGNWQSGHVFLKEKKAHVLLVTLNKQGKAEAHRYLDHWVDDRTFHWQSQNSTTPESKRGKEIIEHERLGLSVHLFVRDNKLRGGKAAPFIYYGACKYKSHIGSQPMSVLLECQ